VDRVKKLMSAGLTLPSAIKEALGMSVTAFADKHDLSRSIASEVINLERGPREPYCSALAHELGGSAYEWAELLWSEAKPQPERFAAA
jgi:hypothetical protein